MRHSDKSISQTRWRKRAEMVDAALQRKNMVESQVRPSDVTDRRITAAMRKIPRELFVPPAMADLAYMDTELVIAPGRAMTAPRDLARLLQLADIASTDRVLIVGGARGYTAAVVAELAQTVVSLESDPDLSAAATLALTETMTPATITVVNGPLAAGAPDGGPYDVIFIDGAIGELPDPLASQLASAGRIVCVTTDGGVGRATLYTKSQSAASALARRFVFEASAVALPGLVPIVKPFRF